MRSVSPLLFLLILFSCSSSTPAGFWEDFRKDLRKENVNDQGPRGGRRAMYWRSDKATFNSKDVIDFAVKNGWELVDDASTGIYAPRWIDGTINVYAFKTGWVLVNPDNEESNEINGFVALNDDGSEMEVFHVWGE